MRGWFGKSQAELDAEKKALEQQALEAATKKTAEKIARQKEQGMKQSFEEAFGDKWAHTTSRQAAKEALAAKPERQERPKSAAEIRKTAAPLAFTADAKHPAPTPGFLTPELRKAKLAPWTTARKAEHSRLVKELNEKQAAAQKKVTEDLSAKEARSQKERNKIAAIVEETNATMKVKTQPNKSVLMTFSSSQKPTTKPAKTELPQGKPRAINFGLWSERNAAAAKIRAEKEAALALAAAPTLKV